MSKPRKQSNYKPAPPIKGTLMCERQHRWTVVDLNLERKVVKCPICSSLTDIKKAIQ
jgi:hypothetical protein